MMVPNSIEKPINKLIYKLILFMNVKSITFDIKILTLYRRKGTKKIIFILAVM